MLSHGSRNLCLLQDRQGPREAAVKACFFLPETSIETLKFFICKKKMNVFLAYVGSRLLTVNLFSDQQEQRKAAEVSTPELTCVPERKLNLEHSLSFCPHDSSVNPAISSMNENGRKDLSPRHETVAEGGVKTQERKILEMVQQPVAEEEDLAETETQTHKRARVESSSLGKADGEMEKKASEGEPSCRSQKSSAEPGDSQRKNLPEPCSVTQQLAKVKQSILDTVASVRQFRCELERKEQSIVDTLSIVRLFRSEIEEKEDILEASLLEIDVLGM